MLALLRFARERRFRHARSQSSRSRSGLPHAGACYAGPVHEPRGMTDRNAEATPQDEVLLSRWCGGDIAAGNELIKRYLRPLRLYLGSKLSSEHDVQDLAQTTLATCAELARRSGGR